MDMNTYTARRAYPREVAKTSYSTSAPSIPLHFYNVERTHPLSTGPMQLHLSNGLRCVLYPGKLRDLAGVRLRLGQHGFVMQEQYVLRIRFSRLPPLQHVVEP